MAENDTTMGATLPITDASGPAPEWARPKVACKMFGFQQSLLYDLKRQNKITMKKVSSRAVLVDLNSVRRFIASLPDA